MKSFLTMKINLEKTLVFIDEGYLSKISKNFGKGKHIKIDYLKFAKYLSIKEGLWCEHIFYYTAPPYQSPIPTQDEAKRKAGYDSFITKLKLNKEITVRKGRLQKNDDGFTQKGVDTLLTMDLIEEPIKRDIKTIILIACDTDFVPILNNLRKEKDIRVILFYYTDRKRNSNFSMSNHILTACDKKVLLQQDHFIENIRKNTT